MNFFAIILAVMVSAVFVNNFILVQFLGICPFLGVSKKTGSALGMGIAVTLVMILATAICYPLYTYVLVPLDLGYLEIIFFIFIIAALVQMLENVIRKFTPALYRTMGIYLPLITTNCAILGVTELVIDEAQMLSTLGIESMNFGVALLYALFAGIGFTLAIVLMSGSTSANAESSCGLKVPQAPPEIISAVSLRPRAPLYTRLDLSAS